MLKRRPICNDMKNKATRFLIGSVAVVSVLCIGIFSFLAVYMAQQSSQTISRVGTVYMSGMSEQISLHFETTIALRLSQVEALVHSTPPDSSRPIEEIRDELAYSAKARGFNYLALLTEEGYFDMIYGEELHIIDPQPFLDSLNSDQMKVAVGTDSEGNRVMLLGVSVIYPTKQGNCTALVAGLPVDYLTETLSLNENDSMVYSFVIRQDGSFVIRTSDAFRDSYFNRVETLYEDVDGLTPQEYLEELQMAMAKNEDYSTEFRIYGELRHLYCTRLAYSEWYLLTFMPYGSLDQIIDDFSGRWLRLAFGSCFLILGALAVIFTRYFQMTRQQIQELNQARQIAEKATQDAEKAKKKAVEANQAKSEFLSNMSHDIRTPMNAVVGMTAIATANIDNKAQVQECLKKISLSSKHLLGLINDVLDMSKIESGKMSLNIDQVSLREVIESIVSIVQPQLRAKRQHFDVFIHDISTESVLCDSVRLNQVLLNLLSNAIKFTPEGGTIHIALYEEASSKGQDFVRIHIQVRDTGVGMTPEFQKKIFEPFTREDSARVQRTEGTGLGMAITKYIVDTMGGTIQLTSAPGEGTEFHIVLDLEKALEQNIEMILPEWNMLVVDDDKQLCESTVASLKDIGIHADWTLDGESALKMILQKHNQHQDYHVILLDWKLPGMDGVETAREIRRQMGQDIPILIISAYDWSDIEDKAKEAGINGFISKPLFKSTLFYGLKTYVEKEILPERPTEQQPDFQGMQLLLAEDNELNWEVAEELLKELNLNLEWAENGQLCVEKFAASPEGFYKAILMDIRMPVMNGYEATQAIRKLNRGDAGVPIIAMTADAFSEDIKHCLDCGMNAHIAKPIDVREIARLLNKFIAQ